MKNQLSFRHTNSTIAYLESIMPPDLTKMEKKSKDKLNLEMTHLKYFQILDSEMDRYFVAYSCQESSVFKNSKKEIIKDDELFKHAKFQMNDKGSDTKLRIVFDDINVTKQIFHKEKIQIFWKPIKQKSGAWKHEIDQRKLKKIIEEMN